MCTTCLTARRIGRDNATYLILKAIGSPYGVLPSGLPDMHDFQPRVGLAWDVGGRGKNIFRVSYGIFYDEQIKNTTYLIDQQEPAADGYLLHIDRRQSGFWLECESGADAAACHSADLEVVPGRTELGRLLVRSEPHEGRTVAAIPHRLVASVWRQLRARRRPHRYLRIQLVASSSTSIRLLMACGRWLRRSRAPLAAHRCWDRYMSIRP